MDANPKEQETDTHSEQEADTHYTVQEGETLWGISKKLDLDINELASLNTMDDHQPHDLPIGLNLKLPESSDQFDTELTLRLVDLAFAPLKDATLKLYYDGEMHDVVTNAGGLIPVIQIFDHTKGFKVEFKHLDGSFFVIADHKTLPLGKKLLTISSRKMVVKGNFDVKEGPQHQSIKQVKFEIKQQNQTALIPVDKKPTKPAAAKPAPPKKPATPPPEEPGWMDRIEAGAEHASSSVKHGAEEIYDSAKHGINSVREWISPTTPPQPANKSLRTEGGAPTQVISALFAEENLRLSPANEKYRKIIIATAKKYDLAPHALAALIQVEANGGDNGWDPNSFNKKQKSGAAGLTQFLVGTWLQMCTEARSPMNKRLKEENGYEQINSKGSGKNYSIYGVKTKIVDGKQKKEKIDIKSDDVLAWRFIPEYSIDASGLYGRINVDALIKAGVDCSKVGPEDLPKLIYMAHHEGAAGAYKVIYDKFTSDDGAELLETQVGKDGAAEWLKLAEDDYKKAYLWFLYDYVDKVDVAHFMVDPKGLKCKTMREITTVLGGVPPSPLPPRPEKKTKKTKKTPKHVKSKPTANAPAKSAESSWSMDVSLAAIVDNGLGTLKNWLSFGSKWHNPLANCKLRTARLPRKISATFGMVRFREDGTRKPHQGIDLEAKAGNYLDKDNPISGEPVYAVAHCKVISVHKGFAEKGERDYGGTITIAVDVEDLPDKQKNLYFKIRPKNKFVYFFYAHLSAINVQVGKFYEPGDKIGETGCSGNAAKYNMTTIEKGSHLHFEAHDLSPPAASGLGGRIDPLPFIDNLKS